MYINVRNISFSYNNSRKVLDDISFSVIKGETLAIVGASGSGKSTILRLIAGILPEGTQNRFKGEIIVDDNSPIDFLKQGKLAFMFQEPTLFPNRNVKENIEIPMHIKNCLDNQKIDELIETVGLKGFENYLPKDLSGGMKTRVSLARSFVTNPDLLLLDEPFSSLDIAWKDALYFELNELQSKHNTTIVMVTHDIKEALELSDKVLCISTEGKVLIEETSNEDGYLFELIENKIIEDHNLRKRIEEKDIIYSN